ncbi:MAG: potassium transporter Kup [Myxococcota bacterium]
MTQHEARQRQDELVEAAAEPVAAEPRPPPAPPGPIAPRAALSRWRAAVAHRARENRPLAAMSLAALGIVYGDIGTSPIYAIRECFGAAYGLARTPENVLGILSLIFWALVVVISFKYLALVLRADLQGEGGIMVLTALAIPPGRAVGRGPRWGLLLIGLFGAALLWGDSMITPAISVLSAVEGLEVASPGLHAWVVPLTLGILAGLFLFQSRGTAGVGALFGPVTLVWFGVLGVLGAVHLVHHPAVLAAIWPGHALGFLVANRLAGFLVLGSVFLVVTGGEALYADMGHLGARPIRLTWFGVVLPALLLNYFGQGALILADPAAADQPFFRLAPSWFAYPLLAITTAATIIASQAVISGAFSLTRQAIQLGYLPRMEVRHTSTTTEGKIYLPAVNWALAVACGLLVVGFGTSSRLAAAYGVAVTTTMLFTTVLFVVVAYTRFRWSLALLVPLTAGLGALDLAFWTSSLHKIPDGGWFSLVVAAGFFVLMTTWKRGRELLSERLAEISVPYEACLGRLDASDVVRAPGTAVYMHSDPRRVPPALIKNLEHNHVLHERIVDLTVVVRDEPYVPEAERVTYEARRPDLFTVQLAFGFAEQPNVPRQLAKLELGGRGFDLAETTFFLGSERLVATARPGMAVWRENLFARMTRNAQRATDWFGLPPDRVIELGRPSSSDTARRGRAATGPASTRRCCPAAPAASRRPRRPRRARWCGRSGRARRAARPWARRASRPRGRRRRARPRRPPSTGPRRR